MFLALTRRLVLQGMAAFQRGDIEESLVNFDAAPHAWQRGLSLYYAERYDEAAAQFAADVATNPYDTEESIWNYLANARGRGLNVARQNFIVIQGERRPVMREVYRMFQTDDTTRVERIQGTPADRFYASLYLGLYHEAHGDAAESARWIDAAVATDYSDYMHDLAVVHQKRRSLAR